MLRVLAVLIALGLLAGPVDARVLESPATAALTVSIDEADELADVALIVPPLTPLEHARAESMLIRSDVPPRYEYCWFVFRPPRSFAFN